MSNHLDMAALAFRAVERAMAKPPPDPEPPPCDICGCARPDADPDEKFNLCEDPDCHRASAEQAALDRADEEERTR